MTHRTDPDPNIQGISTNGRTNVCAAWETGTPKRADPHHDGYTRTKGSLAAARDNPWVGVGLPAREFDIDDVAGLQDAHFGRSQGQGSA